MQSHNRPTNTHSSFLKLTMTWAVASVLPIAAGFLFLKTAHAGLLSFVNSLMGGEQASAQIGADASALNTQTMSVLQGYAAFSPTAVLADDVIPVNDDTLQPEIAESNLAGPESGSSQISTYVVRSGDTLSGIAQMFNVSVNTILWANDISRTAPLQAGQTLIILPVTGISYTVKTGDTVQGVVSKYKADINEVLRFNDLTLGSTLSVGQTIIIPDAEITTAQTPQAPASSSHSTAKGVGNERELDPWWTWPSLPGYFIRPIIGGVKSQGLHGHNAVDLAAPIGTVIRAAAAGIVIISKTGGWNGGYGNFVVVSHSNGTQTLYAHMSRTAVSPGQTVSQGETIGHIGMTGLTTGPHVHFEIRGAQNPF